MDRAEKYRNYEELIQAATTLPQDQEWYTRIEQGPPLEWDPLVHGPWDYEAVNRGFITTYPSSNRSEKNKSNDRHVFIIISSRASDHLGYIHESRHVIAFLCSTRSNAKDVCNRVSFLIIEVLISNYI